MNVFITGVSRGIGFELVKKFADNHTVYCISRNVQPIESLNLGNVKTLRFDFLNKDKEAFEKFIQGIESIDVLINNAGFLVNKPFEEITEGDLLKMYEVNVLSPYWLIQQVLPKLKKANGHVVNISSVGGVQGSVKFPGLSGYSSSKGALSILTECLAEEYKESGVKFNCLALGAVQTEMLEQAFPGYKAPLTPKEMAEFIFDFSLKMGKYINGKIIPVSISTP